MFHADGHRWLTVVRLFRGPFHITLFIFLIGINVHGWRSAGVNHVLIFELNPRSHLSAQALMEIAAIFGVIWAVMVLCFLYRSAPPAMMAYVSLDVSVVKLGNLGGKANLMEKIYTSSSI